jgi:uncharacterized Zn finger protein (UPF0148 family)
VTVLDCEACGTPIYDAEPGQLLCDLCTRVIDAQTDLLLELYDRFGLGPDDQ